MSVFVEPYSGVTKTVTSCRRCRRLTSNKCLSLLKRNPKQILLRFVTVVETRIQWNTSETKEQSKYWNSTGGYAPKEAKAVLSAGKVICTRFRDSEGMIYIDCLGKVKTGIKRLKHRCVGVSSKSRLF